MDRPYYPRRKLDVLTKKLQQTNYPLLRVGDNFILSIFGYDDLCKSRLKKQPKAMLKSLVYSYHNLLSVSEKDNRGLSPYCLL